jgi:hypothetical protein
MESGTVILIERMKTHPEEFLDPYAGKWQRVMEMVDCLPEEDKLAIKQAKNRMYIDDFNGLVLKTLAGEVDHDPNTLTVKARGRYTTAWNDPRQMALAEQAMKNIPQGSVITKASGSSYGGLDQNSGLLQPSAFGAVPVSNYSSGES